MAVEGCQAEGEGEARENCWPLRERETETSVREVEEEETSVREVDEEETSVEWVAETSVEWVREAKELQSRRAPRRIVGS